MINVRVYWKDSIIARHHLHSLYSNVAEPLAVRSYRHILYASIVKKNAAVAIYSLLSGMFTTFTLAGNNIEFATAEGLEWIGAITLEWIGILHLPSVALVCQDANKAVRVPWQWVRHQPRDGIRLRSDRCTSCGWFTNIKYRDEEQCDVCCNTAVCESCTYVTTTGRRLCAQCPLETGSPRHIGAMVHFLDTLDLYDKIDYLQLSGDHHSHKENKRICFGKELNKRDIFTVWMHIIYPPQIDFANWLNLLCINETTGEFLSEIPVEYTSKIARQYLWRMYETLQPSGMQPHELARPWLSSR